MVIIQPLSTRLTKPNFCFHLSIRRSTTFSLETRNAFKFVRCVWGLFPLLVHQSYRWFKYGFSCIRNILIFKLILAITGIFELRVNVENFDRSFTIRRVELSLFVGDLNVLVLTFFIFTLSESYVFLRVKYSIYAKELTLIATTSFLNVFE